MTAFILRDSLIGGFSNRVDILEGLSEGDFAVEVEKSDISNICRPKKN